MGSPKPVSVYAATFQKLLNRPEVKDKKAYTPSHAIPDLKCDVEDMATAIIRFDNGAVLNVEASFSLNLKQDVGSIELFGTKAGAKIDPELEMFKNENNYMANVNLCMPTALSFDGLFTNEIAHFVDCIREGKTCVSPASDGVEMMRILEAAYESARTGHEVIID